MVFFCSLICDNLIHNRFFKNAFSESEEQLKKSRFSLLSHLIYHPSIFRREAGCLNFFPGFRQMSLATDQSTMFGFFYILHSRDKIGLKTVIFLLLHFYVFLSLKLPLMLRIYLSDTAVYPRVSRSSFLLCFPTALSPSVPSLWLKCPLASS